TTNGNTLAASFPIANSSVVTPETLYLDYWKNGQHVSRSSSSVGLGRFGVRAHSELLAQRSIFLATRLRTTPDDLANRFTRLLDTVGIDPLVRSLEVLEPRLQNLSIGSYRTSETTSQVQLRAHIAGLSKPLPLYVLGEGVGRLAEILLAISSLREGTLFV